MTDLTHSNIPNLNRDEIISTFHNSQGHCRSHANINYPASTQFVRMLYNYIHGIFLNLIRKALYIQYNEEKTFYFLTKSKTKNK